MIANAKIQNDDAEAIRNRMQQVRDGLPLSIISAKAEVRELTDWKFYIRNYPSVLLPIIALTGFVLVPEKPNAPVTIPRGFASGWLKTEQPPPATAAKQSLLTGIASAAAGIALRSLTTYATKQFSGAIHNFINNRSSAMPSRSPKTESHN